MSVKIKLDALQGALLGLSAAARCVFERLRGRVGLYKAVKSGMAIISLPPACLPVHAAAQCGSRDAGAGAVRRAGNSTDNLKTLCWCVFNRVDNAAFPGTLEAVIDTPKQWMGYSAGNPVLENLYQIAREQLESWHGDGHRPVADTFVFMSWAPDDICLRDQWTAGSGTKYWRWGQ